MKTLLLDTGAWDLITDNAGNIAIAAEPYALAQDVASAVKTFIGEIYYDTSQGIPYFEQVLGKFPPIALLRAQLVRVALTVPGVVSVRVIFISFSKRTLTGQLQFIDTTGASNNVKF
jgi:hypothetical protein